MTTKKADLTGQRQATLKDATSRARERGRFAQLLADGFDVVVVHQPAGSGEQSTSPSAASSAAVPEGEPERRPGS